MTRDNSSLRLGDLLTAAGLLKLEQLREAIEIARMQSLPVGRVLIMSGYLTELQLQASVQLQSMLKDGLIDFDRSLQVLGLMSKGDMALDEALTQAGFKQANAPKTNKLGELLVNAGSIDGGQLAAALKQSELTGLPLGRLLVNMGVITEQLLSSALSAQVLIRGGKITRTQAIQALIAARDRQVSLEQCLAEIGTVQLPTQPTIRLGQLLLMAGIVDEKELMRAVELGLVQDKPLGKMLLSLNLISEENLAKALEAQALVANGLDIDQAANILTTASAKSITISHAASLLLGSQAAASKQEHDSLPLPLFQFLQLAGMMGSKELEQAIRIGTQDTEIMAKMLLKAQILEPRLVDAAVACSELIAKRILKTEQAIMALNHCKHTHGSIFESFGEFGWTQPADAAEVPQPMDLDAVAALGNVVLQNASIEAQQLRQAQSGSHPPLQKQEQKQERHTQSSSGPYQPVTNSGQFPPAPTASGQFAPIIAPLHEPTPEVQPTTASGSFPAVPAKKPDNREVAGQLFSQLGASAEPWAVQKQARTGENSMIELGEDPEKTEDQKKKPRKRLIDLIP
jgi:hypothetical protein